MINIIKHEKSQFNDIILQIDEKLELFNFMMKNIEEMQPTIELKKENPNIIIKIDNKYLIKDLIRKNMTKFSKDTINYFQDLGIYFLYTINVD